MVFTVPDVLRLCSVDVRVVPRDQWGAQQFNPKVKFKPLPLPITKVQIVSSTDTDDCDCKEDCINIIRQLQTLHIEEDGMSDINYNFLIGGDGNIYEGLGWEKKVQKHPTWPSDVSDSLVVVLVGNFIGSSPPEFMLKTFEEFIARNAYEGRLSRDYVAINV